MRDFILAMITLILLAPVSAAAGCVSGQFGSGGETINPLNINQSLFDRLVLEEVNRQRCLRGGLTEVRRDRNLRRASLDHAHWMSDTSTISHYSSKPEHHDLGDRMKYAGITYQRATENLARVSYFKLDMHRVFRINDADSCSFSSRDGRPIPAHSYRSLATYVVQLWIDSPGHAKKISLTISWIFMAPPYPSIGAGAIAATFISPKFFGADCTNTTTTTIGAEIPSPERITYQEQPPLE